MMVSREDIRDLVAAAHNLSVEQALRGGQYARLVACRDDMCLAMAREGYTPRQSAEVIGLSVPRVNRTLREQRQAHVVLCDLDRPLRVALEDTLAPLRAGAGPALSYIWTEILRERPEGTPGERAHGFYALRGRAPVARRVADYLERHSHQNAATLLRLRCAA